MIMGFVRIVVFLFLVWSGVGASINTRKSHATNSGARILELRKLLQQSTQQGPDIMGAGIDSSHPPSFQPELSQSVREHSTEKQGKPLEGSGQTEEFSSGADRSGGFTSAENSKGGGDGGDENSDSVLDNLPSDVKTGNNEGQAQKQASSEGISNSKVNSVQWLKDTLKLLTKDDPVNSAAGTPSNAPSLADSSPSQQGATDDYYSNRFRAAQANDITEHDLDKERFASPPTTVLTVTGRETTTSPNKQQNENPVNSFG